MTKINFLSGSSININLLKNTGQKNPQVIDTTANTKLQTVYKYF